jgi:DNA-binding response OmpR family regulator
MNLHDQERQTTPLSWPHPKDLGVSTVLCVDDDPNVSEAIARGLYRHGIRVLRAFLGIQGLSQAITQKPDLIILDLAMPKGQGTEIIECLKRNPQTAQIPVLILTGNQDPAMKGRVMRLGAAGYFNKPIVFDELLDEIRRHIPAPVVSADAADCR